MSETTRKVYDRLFVCRVAENQTEANRFMEKNPDYGLIDTDHEGRHYLAIMTDKGKPAR